MAGPESKLGSSGAKCHPTVGIQGDSQSPRAEGAGHGAWGAHPASGPGQESEPGAAPLGARGSVNSFQPRHPGSGVRDQPLTPCSILCNWLAALVVHSLPGGQRGQAPVTLSFCCSSKCQGYSQKGKAPRLPQGTWVESGGFHPLQRQGLAGHLDGMKGREAPSSATSLLQGQQGQPVPK